MMRRWDALADAYIEEYKARGVSEDYLVREGVWSDNPLKWMQGPKLTPYHRMPKRIDGKDMKALWSAAATGRGHFQRHLGITILSILYGAGLRRGELARLNVADWNREAKGNHGYLAQDEPVLHFGLGAIASVDVVVDFVDGSQTTVSDVAANQRILIDACPP
jgi:hypothetical protein